MMLESALLMGAVVAVPAARLVLCCGGRDDAGLGGMSETRELVSCLC